MALPRVRAGFTADFLVTSEPRKEETASIIMHLLAQRHTHAHTHKDAL